MKDKVYNLQAGEILLYNGLTIKENKLAEYMSELSQEAYYASWNSGLEYHLWIAMMGDTKEYGELIITSEVINKLSELSEAINGWIIWDDVKEQIIFVTMDNWMNYYEIYKKMK